MRTAGRAFLLAGAVVAMSPLVSAYYYYVFFASGTGPYAPLAAHFDLNAIKDNTVQYFISDQAPAPVMPGDSLTAIGIRTTAAILPTTPIICASISSAAVSGSVTTW